MLHFTPDLILLLARKAAETRKSIVCLSCCRAAQPFPTLLGTLDATHMGSALAWQQAPRSRSPETDLSKSDRKRDYIPEAIQKAESQNDRHLI